MSAKVVGWDLERDFVQDVVLIRVIGKADAFENDSSSNRKAAHTASRLRLSHLLTVGYDAFQISKPGQRLGDLKQVLLGGGDLRNQATEDERDDEQAGQGQMETLDGDIDQHGQDDCRHHQLEGG